MTAMRCAIRFTSTTTRPATGSSQKKRTLWTARKCSTEAVNQEPGKLDGLPGFFCAGNSKKSDQPPGAGAAGGELVEAALDWPGLLASLCHSKMRVTAHEPIFGCSSVRILSPDERHELNPP